MTDDLRLSGSLEALSLAGLVQLLAAEGRSGRIDIEAQGVSGALWLKAGILVHARHEGAAGVTEGEPALDSLVALQRGTFTVIAGEAAPAQTLQGPTEQLLMEAAVRQDHAGRGAEGGLPPHAVPSFAPVPPGGATPRFTTLQWRVLASIDGRKTIEQMAPEVQLPVGTLAGLLADLEAAGVIRIT